MPTRIIQGIEELKTLIGQEVGASEWFEVTQSRIDAFAAATEDHQWIHIDIERVKTDSPFKTTIAHGFLTLSLLPHLAARALKVEGNFKMGINYGLNRVRFISPVPAGSKIRGRFKLANVDEIKDGVQATWNVTVERDGSEKPSCAAEWLVRYYR